MNYRFVHLSGVYPFVARSVANLATGRESYSDILNLFVGARFGWSDAYVRQMNGLGNPSTLIFPEPILLKAWALENGRTYEDGSRYTKAAVLMQIVEQEPDVVLLSDLYYCDRLFRQELRDRLRKGAVIIGWRSAPTDDFGAFADLDLMLTGSSLFACQFRNAGTKAEHLPLAFDPATLDDAPEPQRDLEFTFAGTIGDGRGQHSERFRLVSFLMKNTPLQVWGECPIPSASWRQRTAIGASTLLGKTGVSSEVQQSIPLLRRGAKWKKDADESAAALKRNYPARVHPPVFGPDYSRVMRRSRLTFNSHIDVAASHGGNIRLFETTGAGACLLTDSKENLADFFVPDVEISTYRTPEEAVEKANFLLCHPDQCRIMALAGQRRTLRDHTYEQRAKQLDSYIQSLLTAM